MFSMRMDRCISPRPLTLNASAESVSSTFKETSRSSSRYSLSRRWREVTNLPSLPAKGLLLTEKVISTVGSLILTKGTASTQSVAQTVSPMLMPSSPEKQTMSPACARSTGTRERPSIWYRLTSLPRLLKPTMLWLQTATSWLAFTLPRSILPMPILPT